MILNIDDFHSEFKNKWNTNLVCLPYIGLHNNYSKYEIQFEGFFNILTLGEMNTQLIHYNEIKCIYLHIIQ